MMNSREFNKLLHSSVEYTIKDGVLTIRDYFNVRNSVTLDLSRLTPEMLEELQYSEEDEDYDEEEEEY